MFLRWAVLTLVGACLFLIALRSSLLSFRVIPPSNLASFSFTDINWTNLVIVLVLSFIVMIVISAVLSHFLPQRRIISSVDMVLIGLLMTAILYLYLAPVKLGFVVVGMAMLLYLAGAVDFIMKRIIGLSDMGTHYRTFEVLAPISQLFGKISIDVRDAFGLTRGRKLHGEKAMIYKNTDKKYRLLVVLAEHPIQPDRKSLIHFKIVRAKFDHTFPFRDEIRRILHEPAETKISAMSQLPKRTILVAIGIPVLALALYFQSINQPQNAWLSTIVGVLLVLLPTLPYLRGPAGKKWQTED